MNRRSLSSNWTEEDRRTRAKWMRAMAVFYGCMALFVFAAHADETSVSLYPGRYVTNCKPAPMVGCVCETDSAGQPRWFLQSTSESVDHDGGMRNIEHVRLMQWLRLTCTAMSRSGEVR
jgi:hypothetical protein